MSEYTKYNPENYSPSSIFRPQTGVVEPEVLYLSRSLKKSLEGGLLRRRILRVGAEFEILIFDPDFDPANEDKVEKENNPNYSPKHIKKVKHLLEDMQNLATKDKSMYLQPTKLGCLLIEARTAPQTVENHIETVDRLRDILREKCTEYNVMPVVHSQHLHCSLRANRLSDNVTYDDDVIRSAFSSVNPLVLLPEEWDSVETSCAKSKSATDSITGKRITHPEIRKLSSEYAHDPFLNLLLSLRALYAACVHPKLVEHCSNFGKTYLEGVELMSQNKQLSKFFGDSTLQTLCSIVAQYPEISRRETNVNELEKQ